MCRPIHSAALAVLLACTAVACSSKDLEAQRKSMSSQASNGAVGPVGACGACVEDSAGFDCYATAIDGTKWCYGYLKPGVCPPNTACCDGSTPPPSAQSQACGHGDCA